MILFNDEKLNFYTKKYKKIFVISDPRITKKCLPKINLEYNYLIKIDEGDKSKSIKTCAKIWKKLNQYNFDSKCLIVNLGGGSISDLGGFCASVYKRGIDYINIPTTLIAQSDASIGGKNGINFNNIKNNIGTINEPKAVFIIIELLSTLSKSQKQYGVIEIIKHALIADKKLWDYLIKTKKYNYNFLIKKSLKIKKKFTKQDLYDQKERQALNFGHTIGHAVETYLNIKHEVAISIGIICESYISYKKKYISKKDLIEIENFLIKKIKIKKINLKNKKRILKIMQNDKKNINNKILFSLLNKIGNYKIKEIVNEKLITESLNYYQKNQ